MKKRLLIVVDVQYDFLDYGAFPVKGALSKTTQLMNFIRNHPKEYYSHALLTCDSHPFDHCSFSHFPMHCVNHTFGSAIYDGLMQALLEKFDTNNIFIYPKGENKDVEEFSVFTNEKNKNSIIEFLKKEEFDEIHICGIVGTICVKATLEDLVKYFDSKRIYALTDFTANLNKEGDEEFISTCKALNVNVD